MGNNALNIKSFSSQLVDDIPILTGASGGGIAAVPMFNIEAILWTIFCAIVFAIIGGTVGFFVAKILKKYIK